VLAVASTSHTFKDVKTIDDLPRQLVDNIQEFFVNYPRQLGGKTYKILGSRGPQEANELIEQAHQNT
jgi:inorganic pyrophosphatase